MKHLIVTEDINSLPKVRYDRVILDTTTNEIVYQGVNTNGHSYVDLGLPSGTLWATMNVGAKTETDYGDYFMWGSTTPNTNTPCNWANAPFNNGANDYDEEYFTTHKSEWLDNNGNLKPEFDAARAIMGGDWRIPTMNEFQELIDYTTNEWTTINGVSGRKFTASNGNSIFIPAPGRRLGSSFEFRGINGYFWSSFLSTGNLELSMTLFFNSKPGYIYMGGGRRYYGLVVRGVL